MKATGWTSEIGIGDVEKSQERAKTICFLAQRALWTSGVPLREATVTSLGLVQDDYGSQTTDAHAVAYLAARTSASFTWGALTPDAAWGRYDRVWLRSNYQPNVVHPPIPRNGRSRRPGGSGAESVQEFSAGQVASSRAGPRRQQSRMTLAASVAPRAEVDAVEGEDVAALAPSRCLRRHLPEAPSKARQRWRRVQRGKSRATALQRACRSIRSQSISSGRQTISTSAPSPARRTRDALRVAYRAIRARVRARRSATSARRPDSKRCGVIAPERPFSWAK